MKIVFSTKNVSRASFLDTCRYAYDYGFEGFEIYDAIKERSVHHDSILRRDRIADAKRKLVNRNLAVSALRMPAAVEKEETTAELVQKYVDMAKWQTRKVQVLMGPLAIVIPNSIMGEITPRISYSVGNSGALKILIPINRCNTIIAGTTDQKLNELLEKAVDELLQYHNTMKVR